MNDKCKFCGAEPITNLIKSAYGKTVHYFECETAEYSGELWIQDKQCLRNQLQQSEDRARELFEAMAALATKFPGKQCLRNDAEKHADRIIKKHEEHFRKGGAE